MKKFILSLGLIAMAFSLTNCVQSNDLDSVTKPTTESAQEFALYVPTPRTANDGLNTIWVDGDDLNVFHTVAGSDEYVNDNEFTLADAATGYFKGSLGDENGLSSELTYDWYVCYPYHSGLDKPGYGSAYNIGNTKNAGKQTQKGNNSTAHLSGKYLPLVGVAKGVAANQAPTLTLKHSASYAKFIVKNSLNEPITVTGISISVPGHHLTGNFYIHFADMENISYKAKSNDTAENATLVVEGGSPIAANGQAEFYLAVAPFAKEAGSEATITISATNGDNVTGECVKDASAAAMTFTAGKYKEITLNYNTAFESISLPSVSTETVPYIVGFEASEGFVASTSYKEPDVRYTGVENKQWGTVYGTPSTTSKISGEQSMHIKTYPINGAWSDSYTYTNFTLSSVKEVRFDAKNENYNEVKLSYRVAGQDWTDLQTFTLAGATVKSCKYIFDTPVKNAQFKFTIVPTKEVSGTAGKYVIIDNVVFSSEELAEDFNPVSASVTATTENASETDTTAGTTATLNGAYTLLDATDSDVVSCGFEYKLSSASSYTSVTVTATTPFSYNLTGLTTDATYIYRAWASVNGGEKSYGEEKTFTPKKVSADIKMVEITADDFANIGVKYGYADTDVHTINAADGSVWTAYQVNRSGASSAFVAVRKDNPDGYLATPVVSGTITKIVINIKSGGANNKFTLAHSGNDVFYTSDALGKTEQDWSVDITNGCNQIFIHSAYGTVTINSVTVYYQ